MKKISCYRAFVLLVIGFLVGINTAQTESPNYVETKTYQNENDENSALVSRSYSDGLGRQIQSKVRHNLATGEIDFNNWVSGIIYDDAGRIKKTIHTFPDYNFMDYEGDVSTMAETFIHDNFKRNDNPADPEANYYSETVYSNDPLSRVKEVGGPGKDFFISPISDNNHTKAFWYFGTSTNLTGTPYNTLIDADGFILASNFSSTEKVNRASANNFLNSLGPSFCAWPNLFLTVILDENNNVTQELKDMFGQTIKTWTRKDDQLAIVASYQHDILGNLTRETPPLSTLAPTNYTYNTLGQLETKTISDNMGSGANVYEKYEYDALGRMVKISRYKFGTGYLQVRIDYDALGRIKKKYCVTGTTQSPELSYFYDGVKFNPSISTLLNSTSLNKNETNEILVALDNDGNARGRLTAAMACNAVEESSDSRGIRYDYVMDFYVYDDEGRISVQFKVIPSLPIQRIMFTYDLAGKITTTRIIGGQTTSSYDPSAPNAPDPTVGTIQKEWVFGYDLDGRLKNIYDNSENGSDRYIVVSYDYNKLGKLEKKHFRQEDAGSIPPEYVLNYIYNVQDRLVSVGKMDQTVASDNNFKEEVEYTKLISSYANSAQYNGNISLASYYYGNRKSIIASYSYDNANRLIGTNAFEGLSSPLGGSLSIFSPPRYVTDYDEAFTYDDAGRINTKWVGKSGEELNHTSSYFYYPGSCRLMDYRMQMQVTPVFFYDFNGNLVYDAHKKMVISYDWRNQPICFSFYNEPLPDLSAYSETANTNGTITPEQLKSACATKSSAFVNKVIMLYDADGNRVLKIQKKK